MAEKESKEIVNVIEWMESSGLLVEKMGDAKSQAKNRSNAIKWAKTNLKVNIISPRRGIYLADAMS